MSARSSQLSPRSLLLQDGLIAFTALLVSVLVLVHELAPAHDAPTLLLPAPEGATLASLRPPPTTLQVLAAQSAAFEGVNQALDGALEAVPEVPWGQFGLSNVEIIPSKIEYDPARDRYIQALEDGRVAILSLEPKIQRRVVRAMNNATEPGEATVVIEPHTGRVLAMADDGSEEYGKGLSRRAFAWAASTFKLITAASLFEHSSITPASESCIHGGGQSLQEELLQDNRELDTLCMSFQRAMALSSNVVFARHADRRLNPAQLTETAEKFGFNSKIPFEMPVEISRFQAPTDRLEFARAAAGFQHSRMSPLHGAMIEATISNQGRMMLPTLVESVVDAEGHVVWEHTPIEWRTVLTPQEAARMRDVQATTCTTGTARAEFMHRPGWPSSVQMWGKTGTLLNRRSDGTTPSDPRMYKWFTGIARQNDTEIAVTSLVVQNPEWQISGSYLASEAVLGMFLP